MIPKNMKRYGMLISCLLFLTGSAFVQDNVYNVTPQNMLYIQPCYQGWEDQFGTQFSEISVPIFLSYSFQQNTTVTLRTGRAYINNNNMLNFNGNVDTQIGVSHYFEEENVVVHGGLNLPTGKEELTEEEFMSAYLLSLDQFKFRMPSLGQGLNVTIGIGWAGILSDAVSVGLGTAVQTKGAYSPLADLEDKFDPGSEVTITGGLDYQVDATAILSADILYSIYGADKVGGTIVYDAGNKFGLNVKFKKQMNFNLLKLGLRYRTRTKNYIAYAGVLYPEVEKSSPQLIEFEGSFRMSVMSGFFVGFLGDIRWYEKTPLYDGMMLYGAGVAPEFVVNDDLSIPIRAEYFFVRNTRYETMTGLEVSAGLIYLF